MFQIWVRIAGAISFVIGSPLFWSVLRRLNPQRYREKVPILFGFYSSFSEIENESPWQSEGWISKSIEKLEDAKFNNANESDIVQNGTSSACYALPTVLVNSIACKRLCKVLDYGGGTGDVYFQIKRSFSHIQNVEWHVVDDAKLGNVGKIYTENEDNLYFHTTVPKDIEFDVVHTATVFQYIEHYDAILLDLLKNSPEYLCFMRFWATNCPNNYVTTENVHGKNTPFKVLDIATFNTWIERQGYRKLFGGPCSFKASERFVDIPRKYIPQGDVNLVYQLHSE